MGPVRVRVRVTGAEACSALGISREPLCRMLLRGVPTPGKHDRRWGCTQGRGALQERLKLKNLETTITGWSQQASAGLMPD